jgi:hypothetical protein
LPTLPALNLDRHLASSTPISLTQMPHLKSPSTKSPKSDKGELISKNISQSNFAPPPPQESPPNYHYINNQVKCSTLVTCNANLHHLVTFYNPPKLFMMLISTSMYFLYSNTLLSLQYHTLDLSTYITVCSTNTGLLLINFH